MPTPVEFALDYAGRGWPVLPVYGVSDGTTPGMPSVGYCACGDRHCSSPAKHPMTRHGVKDATTDEEQIRQWWKQWPHANVGIACGRVSGIVVIDVDMNATVNGQEALADLQIKNGPLPKTLTARTGGGGFHYIFTYPLEGQIKSGAGRLGPGLDVRSDDAYIVAPPSIHVSGNRYEWANELRPDWLPDWLFALMTAPAPAAKQAPAEYETLLKGVEKGNRNEAATRLAGHYLALGLPPAEVTHLLGRWNDDNDPPLRDLELAGIIKRIARNELLKRGATIPETAEERQGQLQTLSERFGVEFTDIVRVCGQHPFYVFTIGETEVTVPAGDMSVQRAWRRAITAAAALVPATIGAKANPAWRHFANLMMRTARILEPGEEATERGQVRGWLEAFILQHKVWPNGELVSQRDPVNHEGQVYVHPPSFRKFVATEFDQRMNGTRFVQLLMYHGFTKKALWLVLQSGKGFTCRMVRVPTEIVSALNTRESYELPDGDDRDASATKTDVTPSGTSA